MGNRMLVRGFENGKPFDRKLDFQPTLFIDGKKAGEPTHWKTLDGKMVYPVQPGTIRDCKDFIESYKDVHGFGIYGLNQYEYQYISETYTGELNPDTSLIRIFSIDIETKTENGFPNVAIANEEILLISVMDNNTKKVITFGTLDYKNYRSSVRYVKCDNESHMLRQFLTFWSNNHPDVITGWNINTFDIPYLVRRLQYLNLEAELLSPWRMIRDGKTYVNDEQIDIFYIPGVAILDYIELYKKFTFTPRESYKLDHIAEVELGENKLENPFETFKEFYTNDPQEFINYNIHDVYLVDKLEDRLKLINLAFTLAYKAKVNYEDVYSPVKTWDILIYNYLRKKNIVIPFKKSSKASNFVGGYVKEPLAGFQKWVASFDLTSLYPHIIMGYNMSPETITDTQLYVPIDDLVNKTADTSEAIEKGLSLTANGWCYRKDIRGFLPELMDQLYNDRSKAKKEMLKLEQEYEQTKDQTLEKEIARLDTLQQAIKVTLNSGYGAVTNAYFRYFDIRIGEGITTSGQLASRWVARKLNEFMNKSLKTENVDYVIYSDTDSIYLSCEKFITDYADGKSTQEKIEMMNQFCIKVVQPYIDKSYNELAEYMNSYSQMMKMKLEVIADAAIFYKRKKYLLNVYSSEGVVYAEPKLKIKGLSMIQSSTPAVCRDALRDSVKIALSGAEEQIQTFVDKAKTEFFSKTVEEISFTKSANNLSQYTGDNAIYTKGVPLHVRAALIYNHHLKRLKLDKKYELIKEGEKIKYVYLKLPNPFYENVIAFPGKCPKEFGIQEFIDYETQFEKAFLSPLEDLIEPMGWTTEKTSSLEDFFG